jgi:anti-anti-sigma regulatory factor
MIAVLAKIEAESAIEALREIGDQLANADGEVALDLSPVRRIDAAMIRALETLADRADAKAIKIALHGVNVDVYRVLKLVKLTPRFSFVA